MGNHLVHEFTNHLQDIWCDYFNTCALELVCKIWEMLSNFWLAGSVLKCVRVSHSLYFYDKKSSREKNSFKKWDVQQRWKKEIEIVVVNSTSIWYPKCHI